MKREKEKKVVDIVLDLFLSVFVLVIIFLGLILSVDFAGLSIYFILQDVNWNFYALSWILLAEGLILMMIGVMALGSSREYLEGSIGFWFVRGICKLVRPLSLTEVKLALTLLVTGIILFFLGLILFGM